MDHNRDARAEFSALERKLALSHGIVMRIRFTLDGLEVEVELETPSSLLRLLLDELGRDVPFGCTRGLCGACTVLVDGRPERACVLPAERVEASVVRTQKRDA